MGKDIIEKTQTISSKITKFISFFNMCNFIKSDKYYEIYLNFFFFTNM